MAKRITMLFLFTIFAIGMVACSSDDGATTPTTESVAESADTSSAETEAAATAEETTSTAEEATYTELTRAAESGDIIYVDADAAGTNDGSSWANAYTSLADALATATANNQIWVAEGTYYPTEDDDTSVSFAMVDDVAVYGGFDGTETALEERDWENNVTILSGDIGIKGDSSDNSAKVVIAANNLIDGFTITGGNGASGMMGPPSGGGPSGDDGEMGPPPGGEGEAGPPSGGEGPESDLSGDSATADADGADSDQNVGHLTMETLFMGDPAESRDGSGIIIMQVAPTIKNTIITENSGGKGAGVYIGGLPESGEYPTFVNVTISNNVGYGRGGGVAMDLTYAFFIDVIFDSNESISGKGGAIYNDIMAIPLIENGLFINNAADSGAALANDGNSNTVISNSTIYGNIASEEAGALYQGTGAFNDPTVIDTIIWGNVCTQGETSIYNWSESNPVISYAIVEGGYDGEGVLDVDPQFVDPDGMDFDVAAGSLAETAGSDGGTIGFDASLMGQRTDEEIEEIKEYLLSLEGMSTVIPMDLTNPVDSAEAGAIGDIVYVDADADGAADGSSWTDAFTSLQDAINYAGAAYELNGTSVELWVAEGTYVTGDERTDSFILQPGVEIYGGFDGSEASLDERDYEANETILSGEIGDPDVKTDNSYHVIVGADDAIIDGVTISGGYADGVGGETYDNKGGGLLNYEAGIRDIPILDYTLGFDIAVSNVIFEDNYAETGGAAYTFHGGNPVYTNVIFRDNTAKYGGASADVAGTNAIYTNSTFEGNHAIYKGGATFTDYGAMAQYYDSTFEGNSSGTAGGAIYVLDRASQENMNETDFYLVDDTWEMLTDIYSTVYVDGSSFTDNMAGTNGGAMYVYEASYGKVLNATFDNNSATDAAVVANNAATVILDTATTFSNNTPEDVIAEDNSTIETDESTTTVIYTLTETGQGFCYNSDGEKIDCPAEGEAFYGQDAQFTGAAFSYTDNGDGTVTDNVTGLTWEQTPQSGPSSWTEAQDYCEALTLGDIDDWRMPSLKELFSISNFSAGWPYLDTDYFDLAVNDSISKDEQYWADNYYVGKTAEGQYDAAFGVNHATGHIKAYPALVTGPMGKYVRCVYGDEYLINDFVDNGDGTITDNATALMWTQADSGEGMEWEAALAYVQEMNEANYLGYSDWRLPNVKELQSIADYDYAPDAQDEAYDGPALDPMFSVSEITNEAGELDYPYYWTSTSARFQSTGDFYYAWYVAAGRAVDGEGNDSHGAGAVRFDTKSEDGPAGEGGERYYNYVRLVRGGDITETPEGDPNANDTAPELEFTGAGAPNGEEGGLPMPDMAAAAEQLDVTEEALMEALGAPGSEIDFDAAAEALGVTIEELQAALGIE